MADSAVVITAGTGTNIDTRTESTNGNHRQVMVIGDPATNAGIAPVDATAGLKVDLGADNDITGSVTANAGTNLNTSALALEAGGNLAAIKAKTDNIPAQGQALAAASIPVVLTAAQITTLTPPAAISGFATAAKQLADGHNVVVTSAPTTAVTNAGTFAVQAAEADGANVTLGAKADAKSTATDTTAISAMSVLKQISASVQAPPSQAVTNAGTFAVQAATTLAAETTKVIGTVNIAAAQTLATVTAVTAITNALPAGTNAIGKLAANSGVDIGDVDVTSLPALAAGTNTIGATKSVPSDIDINGSNANHADKYYTNAGAVTDGIVWSPAAGKRWHVLTLYIQVSAAATITLEDDLAGGDVARWKAELAANSGVVLTYDKEHPFCSGEDAADLIITTTAGNVYVQAVGYEV